MEIIMYVENCDNISWYMIDDRQNSAHCILPLENY